MSTLTAEYLRSEILHLEADRAELMGRIATNDGALQAMRFLLAKLEAAPQAPIELAPEGD